MTRIVPNVAALALLDSLGFTREATLTDWFLPDTNGILLAGEIIKSFGVIGLERTMNAYNNK